MPDLFAYLRPFRYDRVSRLVVVETGPARLIPGILAELRRLFPEAEIEVLLRQEDAAMATGLDAEVARVVVFEERAHLVRKLRERPFDLIVMQLDPGGSEGLRSLPFVLRGRALMAFNHNLDHFPVNVFRLRDLALHFGLASHGVGFLLAPAFFLYLIGSTGGIYLRGWWRRLRRGRSPAPIVAGESVRAMPKRQDLEKGRAAGSEGS